MNPTADALAAALTLRLPVFPCRASKKPACPHGFRDAVIDAGEIEQLWDRHPGPLIGVPTGAATGFEDSLASWPGWVVDGLMPTPAHRSVESPAAVHTASRYVDAAIAGGIEAVRRAPSVPATRP